MGWRGRPPAGTATPVIRPSAAHQPLAARGFRGWAHTPHTCHTILDSTTATSGVQDEPHELSVCRVAALFVVDRLKSEVVAAAVTHYQALALHKTRRRALKRLAGKYDADCPTNKVPSPILFHLSSVSAAHRLHRHG